MTSQTVVVLAAANLRGTTIRGAMPKFDTTTDVIPCGAGQHSSVFTHPRERTSGELKGKTYLYWP